MTTPKTIKIDETEYVPKDSVPMPQTKKRIVKMPYANDIVGDVEDLGDHYRVHNAAVIRKWGTNNGLGEIAEGGPTIKTVLDKCPSLTIQKTAVIYEMDCNEGNW